jgi:hypothetical protein
MASSKYYAYYIRGRQLAIVQHDYTLGSGQTLSQPGLNSVGARGDVLWKSPTETVVSGLEIEYAYSPRYTLEGGGVAKSDVFRFLGWGSDGATLQLFTFGAADEYDISGATFPADSWIYISGSGRWSGLHQVKSAGTARGILPLKTKCHLNPSEINIGVNFATDETFNGTATLTDEKIEFFKDAINARKSPYVFIANSTNADSKGLFSLNSTDTVGEISLKDRVTIDADGDYIVTAASTSESTGDSIAMHNAFYEQIEVHKEVNVLDDESDTIDLPEYLAKALVYYVKAQIAEDRGELEQKEYNMREFKRLLERNESSKIWGARRIGTDETAIK